MNRFCANRSLFCLNRPAPSLAPFLNAPKGASAHVVANAARKIRANGAVGKSCRSVNDGVFAFHFFFIFVRNDFIFYFLFHKKPPQTVSAAGFFLCESMLSPLVKLSIFLFCFLPKMRPKTPKKASGIFVKTPSLRRSGANYALKSESSQKFSTFLGKTLSFCKEIWYNNIVNFALSLYERKVLKKGQSRTRFFLGGRKDKNRKF